MGQVVRAGFLVVMAGVTWWRVRASSALVLLLGALVLAVLAVIAFAAN